MPQGDVYVAVLLFMVFGAICTISAFLIGAGFKSRRAGILSAVCTLLFFVLLFAGLMVLVRSI